MPSTLTRRGPNTNATCETGFQWAEDAAQLSPCLVTAAVVGGCGSSDYNVPALTSGEVHYNPPGTNGQPINGCSCSWAAYNLYSSCTACQGFDSSILTWAEFRASCGSSLSNTTYYPSDVVTLGNTSIPFYATVDPSTWPNAVFNVNQAQNISEQGDADVYGAPLSSSTTSSVATSSNSNNAAAIGGGVAGGVVVLIIGALAAWWILRKRRRSGVTGIKRRSGKPQELDSTTYDTQGHTRSLSDLTRPLNGNASFGNGNVSGNGANAHMGSVSMQQFGQSPSPFGSSSYMGSVNSMGAFPTPPHQVVGGGIVGSTPPPPSSNGRASTITGITRYDSPSPSMQYMARSQSPDSSFGHEMVIQPFVLPLTTPPSVAVHKGGGYTGEQPAVAAGQEGAMTRRNSQDSLFAPAPQRRVNPPAYDDAVGNTGAPTLSAGLLDSRDVAAQRRETHGTGHNAVRLPVNEKSQPLQAPQTTQGSQDSSIAGPDLAAIDAYVNQMAVSTQRPRPTGNGGSGASGGQGGLDVVPMLHTTAVTPVTPGVPQRRFTTKTIDTTMDDGTSDSVVGDHRGEGGEGNKESVAIA
ncbi:hypothetical protein J3R30DRAFT_3401124 [Lentinula aciculospora]|uniref:Uncharacterized protein n=1 Tax=Lentinula aciculospora TaxID=153920 RepID=A0A9W9APK0_9AGAR|nr:hypothetical protein J3R30DRAFT_3401124 [Lentinula aciculospora]